MKDLTDFRVLKFSFHLLIFYSLHNSQTAAGKAKKYFMFEYFINIYRTMLSWIIWHIKNIINCFNLFGMYYMKRNVDTKGFSTQLIINLNFSEYCRGEF